MEKKNLKKGALAAGGVALLAVASALCVKGMKAVDQRLKAKKEAETVGFDETELFEDVIEVKPAEEVVEEVAAESAEDPAQQEGE
jgi:hypothetical protein